MRNDTIAWDFKKYQPDLVSICLGQNDGMQDSTAFSDNYISFVKTIEGLLSQCDDHLPVKPDGR